MLINKGLQTEEAVEKGTKRSEGYANSGWPREALDRRYGEIGISAVAAAVRYQGEPKAIRPLDDDRDGTDKAA